ncbi:sensor histidine kinase [Streptacidiphilus sp. MAP5-3]|uniref:sensor histidine kinase n=1 Tax=unclassified Streptacidiphilus TaxID=2643834 RepID=UPI003510D6B9
MVQEGTTGSTRQWSATATVVPYLLLGLLVLVTVAEKAGSPTQRGSLPVDLLLCGAAAAWMLWVFTLHPAWRERPHLMAGFFVVLIAITAALVVRDPWFGFFTPAGYIYAFRLLRWPVQLVGVGAVAVVAGTAQANGIDKSTAVGVLGYLGVVLANVVPMCAAAVAMRRRAHDHAERERALAEVSATNRRLEATLAENAALHEQLLAQARAAGVQDERRRMAREIHDTLAQGLTGIITQLHAAEHAAEHAADAPEVRQRHIEAATRLAKESLTEARRSVHALSPEPLESGARLGDAVAGVAERWSALHGIPVRVTTTGTVRALPPEAELALLRTAQEALANVAKHARASRVGVTLSYLEDEVALDVRDDGSGFDPSGVAARVNGSAPVPQGGFGLVAMRQRIEGLAGTLQIESEPGGGTGISARVPRKEEA